MALLLDTHVIIWLEESPSVIADKIRDRIALEAEVYFSKASVWEMAIKIKTGKLAIKSNLSDFVINFQTGYNFRLLEISLDHIYYTNLLPLHHRDPFDRMIIAQSFVENLEVISNDVAFDAYKVKRIW